MNSPVDRRTFLKSASALAACALLPAGCTGLIPLDLTAAPRPRRAAVVRGAFFYPPADVVLAGKCEDGWSHYKWSTWPGNQFKPEEQQALFTDRVRGMADDLDLALEIDDASIYTAAGIESFINDVKSRPPDALLLFNFWNSFSSKLVPIIESFDGPVIIYHPVGANHQLPPKKLDHAPRVQYIHSIENFAALERGLRSVHAHSGMAQSRLLRVSGRLKKEADDREPFFGMDIHGVPTGHFNDLFDEVKVTPEVEQLARFVRGSADRIMDLEEKAFIDAARAHAAVLKLMERHEADAITIECLFLKHRKPCLSFALNNSNLVPCGCENDLTATLSLMLGARLFGRGGFQHNPEFDTEENLYFGSHCTCATKLHGPGGDDAPYLLRPFFHQMPKTLALDVQWPTGEPATLFKYHTGKKTLDAWGGTIESSPACPPTGGCATRVLVKMRDVEDIRSVYPGSHPVLYCGDFVRHAGTYAELYGLTVRGNA